MGISNNINNITRLDTSALTIGSFDGMHVGHMEVINTVKSVAKNKDIPTAVITFDPHPKTVVNGGGQEKWFNITSTNNIFSNKGGRHVWYWDDAWYTKSQIEYLLSLSDPNILTLLNNKLIPPSL